MGEPARSARHKIERKSIQSEEFAQIVNEAEELYGHDELKDKLIFVLNAYTHFINEEYSQAFLLSWISIEQHINKILDDRLSEMGVSNNRTSDIINSPNWFASNKIELAEISNSIEKSTYNDMNEFRKKRNDIVHDMDESDAEVAKGVTTLAIELVAHEVNEIVEIPTTIDRITLWDGS